MKNVILFTQSAVFKFGQDNVKKIIRQNRSKYDHDEVSKLLNQISNGTNHRIVIPEEPNYLVTFKSYGTLSFQRKGCEC
jgi:hypothetical protein